MKSFNSEIKKISAREILDSRGTPTVEATVVLESGAIGTASVPSGASTGVHEAVELRDREKRMHGKGVLRAVESVKEKICPSLIGISALDQVRADSIMITLDGTGNKSNLGANAILSVSLAIARASANHIGIPLYRYLGGSTKNTLPVPMMNILNGGAHADNNIDIQEFMIVPHGAESVTEAVRMGSEVYFHLKKLLTDSGFSSAVGDEGGFAPNLDNERQAIELILKSIERAGLKAGADESLALDVASSEWHSVEEKCYIMPKSNKRMSREDLASMLRTLRDEYPIISIEDGMGEDDVTGWRILTEKMKKDTLLVGDVFDKFHVISHFLFLDKFLLTEKGLTLVVEHTFDLGFEGRKNDVIEKGVHTAEDYSTDYDADDDLHAGINVAFCGGILDNGFCFDSNRASFVADLICGFLDKVHVFSHFLFLDKFCFGFE